jgi:hypothetical protein
VDAVLSRLLEAGPAQLVALADKAECQRRLHEALCRVSRLEHALHATRADLADARSAVQAQRLHIDALTTALHASTQRGAPAAPSPRVRLLPSAEGMGRRHLPDARAHPRVAPAAV